MSNLTGETLNLLVAILLAINSLLIIIVGWLFKAWINSIKASFLEIVQNIKDLQKRIGTVEQRCAFMRGKLNGEYNSDSDTDHHKH
jgi:hypothetical protein